MSDTLGRVRATLRARYAVDYAPELEQLVDELGGLVEDAPTPRAGRG